MDSTGYSEQSKTIMEKASDINRQLSSLWQQSGKKNLSKIHEKLEQAKVLLTQIAFLPMDSSPDESKLILARDILEIGALASVAKENDQGVFEFEKYMSQLKHYYFDFKNKIRKPSPRMLEILGINLLRLLSHNLMVEFHTELELLVLAYSPNVLKDMFIKLAVHAERSLMEGRYNHLDDLQKEPMPSPWLKYFVDHLMANTKEARAQVVERAYLKMSWSEACRILSITNQELEELCAKHNWLRSQDGFVHFQNETEGNKGIDSVEQLKDSLVYAKELDTII